MFRVWISREVTLSPLIYWSHIDLFLYEIPSVLTFVLLFLLTDSLRDLVLYSEYINLWTRLFQYMFYMKVLVYNILKSFPFGCLVIFALAHGEIL